MAVHAKAPPPGGDGGALESSFPGRNDYPSIAPKTAPTQENLLLQAIKALSAAEIRADTLENVPRTLAASGWRSAAALLTHAARCADAGDFLNAERNRQRGREQFITANDAFRQFMEARSVEAGARAFAETFR
jgi:hypothetical protein